MVGIVSCFSSTLGAAVVTGVVSLLPNPPPTNKSTPPNIDTALAGFFFCGLAGSARTSGLFCGGSPSAFPLSTEAVKRSSVAAVCLVLGLVGGGTDALGCLAADVGLVVNNPSSSDGVSERISKPGLDDYSSKKRTYVCMLISMHKCM